jgi:exopolyphosphatase/guanosine-5'-triphosphate,3'-diphosphate pyrophosphatase
VDRSGVRRVAAVDCGTNSLRLLIADVDPGLGQLADVQRRMEIVRLGQDVDATGVLAARALERTFAVLAEYAAAISAAGATAVRMVATSATRDAANAAEFSTGVARILGIGPEVITGSEEASLSFTGATAELAGPAATEHEPPFLVTDIGGGSTEFVLGRAREPAGLAAADPAGVLAAGAGPGVTGMSVNIGCVRMTERHLHGDPPDSDQIEAATADIDAALDEVAAALDVASARTLVGLAGSVTTVTALALGLTGYDPVAIHHAQISAASVHDVTTELLGQTRRERARYGAMHPGRVDVIGAGALVLDRIMSRFGFAAVLASEHDILDGIAWSMVTGAAAGQGTPCARPQ